MLEHRGFIEQELGGEGYRLTDRLFSLGMQQPRMGTLLEIALPMMRELANSVVQSCHLAVHSLGDIVVVARIELAELQGFSVRIGYRRPLPKTASGAVLYAFQPEDVRRRWEALFSPAPSASELDAFRAQADAIRKREVAMTPEQVRRRRHRHFCTGHAGRPSGSRPHRALSQENAVLDVAEANGRAGAAGGPSNFHPTG